VSLKAVGIAAHVSQIIPILSIFKSRWCKCKCNDIDQ